MDNTFIRSGHGPELKAETHPAMAFVGPLIIQGLNSIGQNKSAVYQRWLEAGVFTADRSSSKEPYVIVIPPPNVTDVLHMGHGLNNTLQDVMIRFERMRGREALWLPGTDHAGKICVARRNLIFNRTIENWDSPWIGD